MAIEFDTKKGAEKFSNFLHKASDAGKNAMVAVQESATAMSEKAKQDSYLRRVKKYNPLFPDVYTSDCFNLPNMIVIVDDAVRRGIDVCEGAIGWLSNQNGMEILYLYDEAINIRNLQFIPSATCDAIYYVDSFDRNRYIRTDCIFSKAHEERLAELKHVAHSLGAKFCSIEISETSHTVNRFSKKIALTEKSAATKCSESAESTSSYQDSSQRSGRITVEFEGRNEPRKPKLKWFAHDDNIKRLIEMRCKGDNTIKSETLELAGASSATMSQKTAYAIDGAISKMGFKASASMEKQAITENTSKLIFCIEF